MILLLHNFDLGGVRGLMGMYFGFSLTACAQVASQMVAKWENTSNKLEIHRAAVTLFTTEVLYAEFFSFIRDPQDLVHFPELFIFTLRIALLTLVGH